MHEAAKQWDVQHGFAPAAWPEPGTVDRPIPEGRPCDWCGEPVEIGFVHKECQAKEAEFWLSIIYD